MTFYYAYCWVWILSLSVLIFQKVRDREKHPSSAAIKIIGTFEGNQERIEELRISSESASKWIRYFEVKTIHGRFFKVIVCGKTIVKKEQILRFDKVDHTNYFLIGKIDPTDVDQYEFKYNQGLC